MKGVGVFHDELPPAHQAEARPHFVTKLGLDLVEGERQVAVGVQFTPYQVSHNFFMGWAEAEVTLVPVFQAQQLLAVLFPASAFLPQFGRADRGHEDLLGAGAVHLLAHDGLDLAHDPQTQGEKIVDAARDLADHARSHQQAMAHHFGFGWILTERRDKSLTVSHTNIL